MSIGILLLAAEFLDRKERESEHGYCSVAPPPRIGYTSSSVQPLTRTGCTVSVQPPTRTGKNHKRNSRKQRLKRFQHHQNNNCSNRSTHNQLEKNRRAHMRSCMEQLKKVVPLGPESVKHTTQGLLMKARRLIKSLESSFTLSRLEMDQLRQSQIELRTRLQVLTIGRYRSERSSSESSLSTTTSALSTSPTYESEQIDVVGYGSYCSIGSIDTDELNQVTIDADELSQGSTDSGCGLSPTSRISLDCL